MNRKLYQIALLVIILLLFSCKKDSKSPTPKNTFVLQLSTGQTYTFKYAAGANQADGYFTLDYNPIYYNDGTNLTELRMNLQIDKFNSYVILDAIEPNFSAGTTYDFKTPSTSDSRTGIILTLALPYSVPKIAESKLTFSNYNRYGRITGAIISLDQNGVQVAKGDFDFMAQ
jgi:hypothetical protein